MAFGNDRAEADTALASWYGPGFHGQLTASGEVYDAYGYTAAHKSLPLGTELTVYYGGRSVNVVVNDRGPYSGGRDLDLSQGAAEHLGLTRAGVDWVDFEIAGGGGGYSGHGGGAAQDRAAGYDGSGGQAAAGGGSYVVRSGDTLAGIAAQLGTSVDQLMLDNGLTDPHTVYPGQTLVY